jgi:hypothetical protein
MGIRLRCEQNDFVMQLSGYSIIRKPEFDIPDYMGSEFAQKNLRHLQLLRAAASFLEPTRYRGTGRSWLKPFPSFDESMIEAFAKTGNDMQSNARARRRFLKTVEEFDIKPEEDEDLFANELLAREVFSLLDDSNQYELLQLQRRDFSSSGNLLGYDIGYWSGDHYSLIADCFVKPRWHPPQPDKFPVLAEQLRGLNSYLLFPTPSDAANFRTWYRRQEWAETEGHKDEFEIIQVCTVNPK